MSKEFVIYKIENFSGGLNVKSDSWVGPGGLLPNEAIEAVNCIFDDGINIKSRGGLKTQAAGYNITTPATADPIYAKIIQGNVTYAFVRVSVSTLIKDYLVDLGGTLGGANHVFAILSETPSNETNDVAVVINNDIFYIANGNQAAAPINWNYKVKLTYGGGVWTHSSTKLGITAPAAAMTTAVGAAGNPIGTFVYYYSYYNSSTGTESALSPVSAAVTLASQKGSLSVIAASTDTQVDYKRLYRQGGGSDQILRIDPTANSGYGEITNATTTYLDDQLTLTTEQDCEFNNVLPQCKDIEMHHNQLFAIGSDDYDNYMYSSRFFLPEAVPSTNATIITQDNYMTAVKSFGIDLIIYTQYAMYRHRYIGLDESDYVIEEISNIGCIDRRTLVSVLIGTKPCHIFLGESVNQRGVYLFDGENVIELSKKIRPFFDHSKSYVANQIYLYSTNNYSSAGFVSDRYYLCFAEDSSSKFITVLFDLTDFLKLGSDGIRISLIQWDSTVDTDTLVLAGGESTLDYEGQLWMIKEGEGLKRHYVSTSSAVKTSDDSSAIAMTYQTGYFGDRNVYKTARSLTFNADTAGDTLTVKIYADYVLKATLTCSTASMDRVELNLPNTVYGRLFSVRFEISSTSRITISPPLELKCSPWRKY